MIHVDCEQGSEEWFHARRGIPTASNFHRILTPKTLKMGAGALGYAAELIGERLATFLPAGVENYTNRAMDWGRSTEEEARRWLAMHLDGDVRKCGLCLTDDRRFGASPDALVWNGDALISGVELKCPQPKTHVEYLLAGTLPEEYRAQVHGGMIVTGVNLWHFVSYCPGMKPLHLTVKSDSFTTVLREGLEQFEFQLKADYARVSGR